MIYLVQRPNPEEISRLSHAGFVIRATSEKMAREIAQLESQWDEEEFNWREDATCKRIFPAGEGLEVISHDMRGH